MSEMKRGSGRTVAVLVANGFEEIVMTDMQKALVREGATSRIVSHEVGLANGWHENTWGHNFYIDTKISDVLPSDFDGLLVPGGERSVTALRENAHARRMVRGMMEADKPVAIFGEAVEMLVASETAKGRRVSGPPTSRARVEATGAAWSEDNLTVDGNLVSAATSEDIETTITAFLDILCGPRADALKAA